MAIAHLTGKEEPETEFSSWASSLAYTKQVGEELLECFGSNDCSCGGDAYESAIDGRYSSVIDTEQLWDSNAIFYVPDFDFLSEDDMNYDHEYLVHGVIKGSAHKALPLKVFLAKKESISYKKLSLNDRATCTPFTLKEVVSARNVGEGYGERFASAVTLAILGSKARDFQLFRIRCKASITCYPELQALRCHQVGTQTKQRWKMSRFGKDAET